MFVVIDYNAGNLMNVINALKHLGQPSRVARDEKDLSQAQGIILPGVGAFDRSAQSLQRQGLVQPLRHYVESGTPILGICLGLHLFFLRSEEGGQERGLGLLPGEVLRLPGGVKVPHMGWNRVWLTGSNPLWRGLPDEAHFYFAHSYYPQAAEPRDETARCHYGVEFTASVARENVYGVQFHPEKSGHMGLKLLANFIQLCTGEVVPCC